MSKKILTLTEQRHIWSTLSETFVGLTQQEKYDIIKALGLEGLIGEDGSYIPFYSMDIHSSRPTYITNQFDTKLTANLYNYTEDVSSDVTEWKWERISGNKEEDERWAVGKNTRELDLTHIDFTERFTVEQDITFKVSATIKGKTVTDEIIFSKILYFSKVQIVSDKNVFIESTPEKIRLSFTTDITVDSIRWYIDNRFLSASETFGLYYNLIPLGGSATIKLEVVEEVTGKVFTDSLTIPRISNGTDGEPGVPGEPGISTYTWIKYADGPNGEGMNEYPFKPDGTAREYIGMAVGKDSPTESNNPADYTWTKYIGTDGVPGENGYMWIKYSLYSDGRDPSGDVEMFDTPFIIKPNGERENMVYMGIAYNKQTKTEADPNTPEGAPEQYVWAKIKGEDGRTPFTLELSNDNVSVPVTGSGIAGATAYELAKTDIKLYYGNDIIDPSEYTLEFEPTNVTYILSNNNHTIQITNVTADSGQIVIKAVANTKVIATATFSITKVKGTAIYEILPSSSVIKIITNSDNTQSILPKSIDIKIMKNTGDQVTQVYEGKLTYRYIYSSTVDTEEDGTVIPVDNILTLNNSGDPLFIEFKYFHPMSGVMVDRERIPFVRDGKSSLNNEIRYAKNGSFTVAPIIDVSAQNPTGWTINPPDVGISEILWMTKAIRKEDGTILGTWSVPVRLTGPAGPPGPPGQASDLFIAPMGRWKNDVIYKGNTKRVEAVYYNNKWYVTRTDAGNIPAGTLPTDTTYWNSSDVNYDFVATNLFLANSAAITNLLVNRVRTSDVELCDENSNNSLLKTNPQRIEINDEENSLKMFTGNEPFTPCGSNPQPTVLLKAIRSSYSYTDSSEIDAATLEFRDRNRNSASIIGLDGVFSNSGNSSFIPASTGVGTKASIAGLLFGKESPSIYGVEYFAGVAGLNTIKSEENLKGKNYGGYFNTIAHGATFLSGITANINGGTTKITPEIGIVNIFAANHTIVLPDFKKITDGWNTGTVWMSSVIKLGAGNLTFQWGNGATLIYNVNSGSAGQTTNPFSTNVGRQRYHVYWDGSYWNIFGTN